MILKYQPTIDATLGKSYGFGNKARPYGDVTGVSTEGSPLYTETIKKVREMRREKKEFHPSKEQQMTMGSIYDGTNATLEALYSSGYINRPFYQEPSKKEHPISPELKKAMEEKEPSNRIFAPSIIF
jgi:hypothetical protein